MGKIITSDELAQHNVKKFEFTAIESINEEKTPFNKALFSGETTQDTSKTLHEVPEVQETATPPKEENAQFQKIEDLSEHNVALEMELENLKKDFDTKLQEQQDKAFQDGKEEGIKETQSTLQEHNDDLNIQIIKSITLLDEQLLTHQNFLSSIKDELVDASIIIAKKILKKELSETSEETAINLAQTLLEDLKEASDITLKVNPKDAQYIQAHYEAQKNIKIEADDAINKGGIIILTDIGNIDGTIDTRLEKAIALIEREG